MVKIVFKLLIVEDEKPIREKIVNNVEWAANDYQIYQAANGFKAFEIMRDEDIDIVVTDIKMPKISGIELIRKTRKLTSTVKVIIISGHAEFEYAQQSIRLGVDEYLLKPFRSQRLLKVVNKAKSKILEEQKQKEEIENIRTKIKHFLEENRLQTRLDWLSDDKLFKKHSQMFDNNNRLFQVLKTGSKEELVEEVELVLEKINDYNNQQMILMFTNNIVINTFKTMKDLGYEFDDLIKVIDSQLLEQIDPTNIESIKSWVRSFFDEINNLLISTNGNHNEKIIKEMKEYIEYHYSEGITLGEMANRFNISNGYLSKIFQQHVGEKFTNYINMIRINKAKELLKTTDYKIYEVADEVGFKDSYYFSSWFKKKVGVTPTTYRENLDLL